MLSNPNSRGQQGSNQWSEVPSDTIDGWNQRLLETDATYRQYPYWNESYRKQHFWPRYLIYGDDESPCAYTCILTLGLPWARIGLVHCGLIRLRDHIEIDTLMIQRLAQWAKRRGYVFLRMSHSDQGVLDCIASAGSVAQRDVFPFHGDPRNNLMVKQLEDDDEMLASFQRTARKEIRAAIRAGYEIRVSDSPEEFTSAWPMFQKLAKQKGFQLSPRPLSAWLELIRLARPHQCARLYSAYLDGQRVQAIFVIRYGSTAELMQAALDTTALRGKVSPACLIHWYAMRDFYRLGCDYYNLSGPGDGVRSKVYEFKGKFHPTLIVHPTPITLVINPMLYRWWTDGLLRTFVHLRSRVRRLKAYFRDNKTKTIRELAAESK